MKTRVILVVFVCVIISALVLADQQTVTEDGMTVILRQDGTWAYTDNDTPCWARMQELYEVMSVTQKPEGTTGPERRHKWSVVIHNKSSELLIFTAKVVWVDSEGCWLDFVIQNGLKVNPSDTTTFSNWNMLDSSDAIQIDKVIARVEIIP